MWETAISLLGDINTVSSFYKNVCGIFKKDKNSQHFDRVVEHLGGIRAQVERLSDTILYAPSLQAVQDMGTTRQQQMSNLRDVREQLEPVQRAIGTEILSSAVILTPEKMQQALVKDPWEVLHDIRPVNLFKADRLPPEGVPVLFEHQNTRYLGWQLRGTLPILFNCRYDELWVPESGKRTPQIISSPSASADWVVSPGGKCSTINATLQQAKAGDRIMVKTGLYRENLVINKTIELIAEGSPVIESSNNHCIWMQADSAVVRGFTLQCRAKVEDYRTAVSVPQGQLVLEHCDITSDSLSCVEVCGKGSHVILRGCKIHDSKSGSGVIIYDQATGQLEDCDIFGNAHSGVAISEGGNPVIRRCQIHDGKQGGVYVHDNGSGTLEDCDIFGSALTGVTIRTGGNPLIRRCQIHDEKIRGVWVFENGSGQLEDCDIFGNLVGVEICMGGNPVIRRCQIHDQKADGVNVNENGSGILEDCDIFGNAHSGVRIETGGDPVIRRCTIRNTHFVKENYSGLISKPLLISTLYPAIVVRDNGRGTVEDCDLRDNGGDMAWSIDSTSQVQRRGNKEWVNMNKKSWKFWEW
jgi:nitrous oxidase accessory protein NosD